MNVPILAMLELCLARLRATEQCTVLKTSMVADPTINANKKHKFLHFVESSSLS